MRETFVDRSEAGRRLAIEVGCRIGIPSAVAAVSVGGGVVALALARALGRPLHFAYCAPLSVPWADEEGPEFGALDEDGHAVLDYAALAANRISSDEITEARRRASSETARFYGGHISRAANVLPVPRLLLVEDVLDPGWRMEAAVAYARRGGALRVFVAAVAASPGAASWFRTDADGFIALSVDGDATASLPPASFGYLRAGVTPPSQRAPTAAASRL
jgi:putative phosphoribosyl transferase